MEKINLVELLKDSPEGMELDCTMFENVSFRGIQNGTHQIMIHTPDGIQFLNAFGCYHDSYRAKCVIFPKGKTTWEGFKPPCKFKDGDIVTDIEGAVIIYKGITTCGYCGSFVSLGHNNQLKLHYQSYLTDTIRFATDDEKAKLFQAIKENGCRWNAETKTLEKLSHDKFDITTLKPFDKVLVRDNDEQLWTVDLFGFHGKTPYRFLCVGHYMNQCVPYEGNEHLLGTNYNCDEFYKTWE